MRWLRFNVVGAMGAVVQTLALYVFTHLVGLEYMTSIGLAVELAILHNFAWHVLWTFPVRKMDVSRERSASHGPGGNFSIPRSLLRFQLQTGMTSIGGNLALMWLFVDLIRFPVIGANLLAIALCSTANYFLAERFSFRHQGSYLN